MIVNTKYEWVICRVSVGVIQGNLLPMYPCSVLSRAYPDGTKKLEIPKNNPKYLTTFHRYSGISGKSIYPDTLVKTEMPKVAYFASKMPGHLNVCQCSLNSKLSMNCLIGNVAGTIGDFLAMLAFLCHLWHCFGICWHIL